MQILPILCAISFLSALAYGFHFVHLPTHLLRSLVKTLAVGSLTLISVLSGAPLALTIALAFGTLGDVFLSRDGERNFLFGLAAFLIGHLAYVVLLSQLGGGLTHLIDPLWRLIPSAILIAVALLIVRTLLPHLGAMRLPVLAYSTVILSMGLFALSLPIEWPIILAILGALSFIASDAILGFELFAHKGSERRSAATLLWCLYWGGQALILTAVFLG